ncbi:MAG: TonB-dependent siderophore receptor [Verrucomicrobia bacterium]|nr:TonB-dependent siderophore receptor [Verrucomicrobiota bacterium]
MTEFPTIKGTLRREGRDLSGAELLGGVLLATGIASGAVPETGKPEEAPAGPDRKLDPIVVTADRNKGAYKPERVSNRKYPAPLRDTPKTVTVIPEEIIEEQGARTLTEVLRNVPGISIQAGEGGGASNTSGDMFSMWGFDASQSLFRDGVRDMGLLSRDTFNTETVEVYPGPGGSDVGRGTAAGYVNTATKTPTAEDHYRASVVAGDAQRWRGTADLNRRIPGQGLPSWVGDAAWRLNLMGETGNVPGRDRVEREAWGIAPSAAVGMGTDRRFTLYTQHVGQDNIPDYGLPLNAGRPLPGVNPDWFYGSTRSTHEDINQDMATGVFEFDINRNLTLRNLTRIGRSYRDAVILSPGYNAATNQITRSLQANERTYEAFVNQTTAELKIEHGDFKHTLVAAVEYSNENQDTHTGSRTLAPMAVGAPPVDFAEARPAATTHTLGESETLGVSLFDHVEWGRHWILTGGMRLDDYDTRYRALSPASATNPDGWVDEDTADTVFSGRIGLTYKPVEELSIYAAFGSSVTPPGAANFTLSETGTSQDNPNVEPQEARSVSLGAKWDLLDGDLGLTAALFHTENTNVLYNDDTTGTYYSNGAQVVDGVTLGLNGNLTDNWRIFANATWLDATVDQPGDQYDGFDVIRTPGFSCGLWTTYQLPWNLTVGGGVRYQGAAYANAANTVRSPSYAVVDAMLEYKLNEHVDMRLNLTNLLDRDYIQSINNNTQRGNYGAPFGVTFTTNISF